LRCLSRIGTWTVLRRLNLPAILELTTPEGRKYHVVLASLDGDRATLEIGARLVTLPSSEVERFWDGPFTMIWRSPVAGPVPIQPGMSGRDVAWLRQRLGALDGQPATARANQIYDDELKRRVAVFQQGEALMPDGIAGEETLVRLVATASGANGPTLTAERP
jgi:general secretion pathway protein A